EEVAPLAGDVDQDVREAVAGQGALGPGRAAVARAGEVRGPARLRRARRRQDLVDGDARLAAGERGVEIGDLARPEGVELGAVAAGIPLHVERAGPNRAGRALGGAGLEPHA